MAANGDKDDLTDLAEFVRKIRDRANFPSDVAWAREARYHAPNISKLLAGKAGISGVNLVSLIKAAAERLHEDEVDLALSSPLQPSELREAVARLSILTDRLSALADPPDARGSGQV